MCVEIKFTDKDLPASPGFIEFLYYRIRGLRIDTSWHDQVSETLVPAEFEKRVQYAESVAWPRSGRRSVPAFRSRNSWKYAGGRPVTAQCPVDTR